MKNKIYLWENNVPLFNKEYNQPVPYITPYLLDNDKSDNPCILIIPGGGYSCVCDDHEGKKIAEKLNSIGYSAFVLMYRVEPYHHPVMETDVKRAIRTIRYYSEKFNISKNKIGVMGFSAGGHLCCMAALRYDKDDIINDEIDKISSRPDLAVPCYAVTSLDSEITHHGTKNNCLGENNTQDMADALSSENIIPDDAPPFFLWHTAEDQAVDPECSLRLASALIKKNIPCELHIFPRGPHGLGLAEDDSSVSQWTSLLKTWLDHYFK